MGTAEATRHGTLSERRSKLLAGILSAAVICIVLSPIVENWTSKPADNFPLSYYPMFSKKRGDAIRISHLVGHDSQGNTYRIRYTYAGAGGMNQVRKQIRRQVTKGMADGLCRAVAKRLRRASSEILAKIDTVSVVTSIYALDRYLAGDKSPLSQTVEASCKVR